MTARCPHCGGKLQIIREGNAGKPIANGRFRPPTYKEVREYCRERENNVSPTAFVDFYESKGWLVGKTKMKDWRAAVRNWEKR